MARNPTVHTAFKGNKLLRRAGVAIPYTAKQKEEILKCAEDPVYFIKNHVRIVNIDNGLVPFKMYPFQEDLIDTIHNNRFVIGLLPRQSGKCCFYATLIKIRNKNSNKIEEFINVGTFHDRIKCDSSINIASISPNNKFVESFDITDWEVETDTGWSPIRASHKTVLYEEWRITLVDGSTLVCADDHIVFSADMQEVFVKDLLPYRSFVQTRNGPRLVEKMERLDTSSNMYDLELDDINHRFYTNNILSHNTTTIGSYLLHQVLFNPEHSAAILANKGKTASVIMDRIKKSYGYLPLWMQQGIVEWNKQSIMLENGSRIVAGTTTSDGIRGDTFSTILLDEFAHIHNNKAEEFFESTYPVISSGKTTKVFIISTPKGMNYFYNLWTRAEEGTSGYVPFTVTWNAIPGRDEKWKAEQIANTSELQFSQEFENAFHGSANTLISGPKLKAMAPKRPVHTYNRISFYELPIRIPEEDRKVRRLTANSIYPFDEDYDPRQLDTPSKEGPIDHQYIVVVDVSRGKGIDNSAFSVIDITEYPYRQVAAYHNPDISPYHFPDVIHYVARMYNNAAVLIENNDMGGAVANTLHYDIEYPNVITLSSVNPEIGIKTTQKTKRIGCSNVKDLIENDKLIVCDPETIKEFTTFVQKKATFMADDGNHDDLVMGLVLFGYLVTQQYFLDLTDMNLKSALFAKMAQEIEDNLLPFGFFSDGTEDDDDGDSFFGNVELDEDDKFFP